MTENENATLDHSTNLLDLDDDCLMMIFDRLDLEDTFRLRSLNNERLRALATRRIAQHKDLDVEMRSFPAYREVELELIGGNLRSLDLTAGYSVADYFVLRILRPLCMGAVGGALRKLTLNYIKFNSNYSDCLQIVAPQLHYLDLSNCQLTAELFVPLLRSCVELKELYVLGNYTLTGIWLPAIAETQLQVLHVEIHDEWQDDVVAWAGDHPRIFIVAYDKHRYTKSTFNGDSL